MLLQLQRFTRFLILLDRGFAFISVTIVLVLLPERAECFFGVEYPHLLRSLIKFYAPAPILLHFSEKHVIVDQSR